MLRGPRPFRDAFSDSFELSRVRPSSTVPPPLRTLSAAILAAVAALPIVGLSPKPVAAQEAAHAMLDPLVPKGRIQLEVTPTFSSWDQRFGVNASGGSEVQPLGADLTDPNGTGPFPGIALLKSSLAALTGQSGFTPRIGDLSGAVTQNATRVEAGARLGVFDWLTLGVMVPYVKTRTAIDLAFRADSAGANLGVSPAVTNAAAVSTLLGALANAASAAQANVNAACAGGTSAACSAAQDLAQRVSSYSTNLSQAYYATPFFPRDSSAMATALSAGLASLDGDLTAAGLSPVGQPLVFATDVVDQATFQSLLTDPAAGIQGSSLQTSTGIWTLGDVELSADVRLLQGEVRDSAAAAPRFAWSVTGGALVRLGTGQRGNPDIFLDMGSGDGQMDLEGHVAASLRLGSHLGLQGSFRYGIQRPTVLLRRVAPPGEILAPAASLRPVRWSPGDYTDLEVSPRLELTPALGIAFDYRRFHKAGDHYALTSNALQDIYPVDAAVLDQQTEVSLTEAAVGLRYNTTALLREGRSDTPLELGLRLIWAAGGAGGQVPKATRGELTVTIFHRLWGHQPRSRPTPAPPTG
jgi:hypothetical protein